MEKQSLSQQTARRLYGLIAAEKKLSPGEKLPNELELSQEMGVSRATLREAIREDRAGRWREIWQAKGLGWICEDLGKSKLPGYVNIASYYGSSVYDTAQMSRLIDYIIEECKEQEIETLPPDELSLLKDGWRDTPRKNTE